ncbi:MAG: LysM peptidoglycan-binding domain-containing protein [Bacillota bacterium]
MSDQIMENNVGFQPVAGIANPACPNGQLYTVKSGDTMFFIAKRFNISLQDLIAANPQISDPNTIFPGQVICVPVSAPTVTCPNGQVYRVVRGDTMYEIAKRFRITLEALIAANPQVKDPNLIFPGQELCIPLPPGPVPCPNGQLYTVRSGDTLFDIARANNITLASLIMANPQISDPNLIFPGQVICIPAAMVQVPPSAVPIETPMPMPAPVAPIQQPMPMPLPVPCKPMPRPVMPIEQPMPMPLPAMPPCPAEQGAMHQMPIYIVIPWEECPYRHKKKKHERHNRRCR